MEISVMPFSLYHASVGTYLQILPSVAALVIKAESHCSEKGLADEALTGAKLADDMWPFSQQVFACAHHSARAIEGLRAGVFGPETGPAPLDFASLHRQIADAQAFLEAVDPAEINGLIGKDMRFEFGTRRMDFTAEDFLLTFALPNFYFHSSSAYAILRNQGLKVGKMDYIGKIRLKG
jgi:hypothetical protein